MIDQNLITLLFAVGAGLISAWAIIKYVITMELRIKPAVFKHIYYSLDLTTHKTVFSEEIRIENRTSVEFVAFIKYEESPYFYINHGERLLSAGWHGKDFTTRITFLRFQHKKMCEFLKNLCEYKINHKQEIPVYITTPNFVDNIGKIRTKSICPIQPKNIWSDIEGEIQDCLESEYKKVGIILHGPPGNGKTSFIKYIAEKYKMPTYYITFTPEYDNISIMTMFSHIPKKSLVILEDFDSYFDKKQCTMQNNLNGAASTVKFTFDTILNSLDGVYNSYEKTVFIMTANDIEKVDNSLKCRPSRFKIVREFPNPNKETIDRFIPEPWNKFITNVNYDQLMRIAEFKNKGHTITKVFEMLSLDQPKEVFALAQKIYEDRMINNIEGNAESDFLKACQQFDEMNK